MNIKTGYLTKTIKPKETFKIKRLYPNMPLQVEVGAELSAGEIIAKGTEMKVLFKMNLRRVFETKDIDKYIQVLEGEVVVEDKLLAEGRVKGRKVKRVRSPVNGIVKIEDPYIYVVRGDCEKTETIPIDAKFLEASKNYLAIESSAVDLKYNLGFGSLESYEYTQELFVIENSGKVLTGLKNKGYKPEDIESKIIVVARNLLPKVYEDAKYYQAKGVICGSLRYSDYVAIEEKLQIPIFVMGSWGVGAVSEEKLSFFEQGTVVKFDPKNKGIIVNLTEDFYQRYVGPSNTQTVVNLEASNAVVVHGYPYEGVEGRIVEILDDDELLVQLMSGENIACDYRNIELVS